MNESTKIYLSLIIIVVLIIAGIFLIKNLNNPNSNIIDENTIKCISSKSTMYSQKACSHCIAQKEILGNYTKLFNIIECDEKIQKCNEAEITATPTWIINDKKIQGIQTLENLKQLAGC